MASFLLRFLLFPGKRDQRTYEVGSVVSWLSMLDLCNSNRVSKISRFKKHVLPDLMRPIPAFSLMFRALWSSAHSDSAFFLRTWMDEQWSSTPYADSLLTTLQNDSFVRKLNFQELIPSCSKCWAPFLSGHSLQLLFPHNYNSNDRKYRLVLSFRTIELLRCTFRNLNCGRI